MDLRTLYQYGLLTIIAIAGIGLSFIWTSDNPEFLTVHFLDVGQGDAVLIQTPDGYEVLIDGGATGAVIRQLATQQSWSDYLIDVVIATHPDTDHVGGLVDVLGRYDVRLVVQTETESDSPAAVALATAITNEGADVRFARAGQVIQVGASTTIQILSPAIATDNWRPNVASVVVRVVYGNTAFMLTGDAPISIEEYIVSKYGPALKSDVLKLGHHGSQTSTSELFLDAISPQYAVVSASLDNRYGHPNQSVMKRVFARNIQTAHTGTDGTITFYSDGVRVWRE